jgi:phosphoenolpyruvate synthase/pyruvate phosphate dikinase
MSKKQRVDYGRYGFDQYQITDLQIIMNLETKEDMREFAETVGHEDVQYGLALLETLALAVLDEETESMTEFPQAREVIERVRHA